jgi:methylthioribose-1-phosphate isomerase
MTLEAIRYHNGTLEVLDQLLLPAETKYIPILGVEDGWKAINKMQVRIHYSSLPSEIKIYSYKYVRN